MTPRPSLSTTRNPLHSNQVRIFFLTNEVKLTTIVVKMTTKRPLIPTILRSKTKLAILELFFSNPDKEHYLREVEKITGYSVGNVRREMMVMEAEGLFSSRHLGRIKLYRLNSSFPLYSEMKKILQKTVGIEGSLRSALADRDDIDFAFVYGSFAEGREKPVSDIDIIIIGEVKPKIVKSIFFEQQSKIGREVNSIVYSKREFLEQAAAKNHFVLSIIKAEKIFVKGDEDEFRRFIQIRQARTA